MYSITFIFALFMSISMSVGLPVADLSRGSIVDLIERRSGSDTPLTNCDLAGAILPNLPSGQRLSAPASDLQLKHVAIGRGTQNYTCTSSDATPSAVGAVATLYDASCLAAFHENLLHEMVGGTLQFPSADELLVSEFLSRYYNNNHSLVSGHHFFTDSTTAVFDLRESGSNDIVFATKQESVPAPQASVKGPNNEGNGAVPWLKLERKAGNGIQEVYRVITAGGQPPMSCNNQPSNIEIEYAAEYWFYG